MRISLRMTEEQHKELRSHLHPGDGREAAAWILCGRRRDEERGIMCARRVFSVPHTDTRRTKASVTWRMSSLYPLLEAGSSLESPAIVHVHSHPEGARGFSAVDDAADRVLHPDLAKIWDDGQPNASLIMLPDGELSGRTYVQGRFIPLDGIFVIGNRIVRYQQIADRSVRPFQASHQQALGAGTTALLNTLRVVVVGCSGTGSIVIELLARLGVGELILIDPDFVQERNLNRIVNSRYSDANRDDPISKVDSLASTIKHNLGPNSPRIISIKGTLAEHWRIAATADVVFGCTDSAEGRMHLDLLCHHYVMPYIDVGVDLRADGDDGLCYAGVAVQYMVPGGDSLLSRHGYRMSVVEAEVLRRENPELYADRVKHGYIEGVEEDRPAVISVNAQAAAMAVNELLARLHGFRAGDPADHAIRRTNLIEEFQTSSRVGARCPVMSRHCGLGDQRQPLGLTGLS